MKVSLEWMQYYSDVALMPEQGIDELVRKLGVQLGAVEEVIDLGKKYEGIVVARVVSCEKHPNADKLKVCMVDDGGVAKNVQRNEAKLVQVVCGAPNVHDGMLVAWLPPGVTVPSSTDKDPFVLEAREIRGVVSNGMLASAHELAISDNHDGILELDKGKPGDSLAEVLALNDYVIDLENKMFTHRPDCFGQLGVARELAGIQHKPFKSPDWYVDFDGSDLRPETDQLPLVIDNQLPDLVTRFTAIAMSGVTIKPSPIWMQTYLSRVGIRPINNIVDLTNYYMMLTGQPIHAYDYDKVKALSNGNGARLTIRKPNKDEAITLLNGKTIKPRSDAMMVAADKQLICVGGAIGGSETEVGPETRNVIIEAANWDMFNIRRTAMEHGIFTDAVTRFTKGQSPLQNDRVVAKICHDIQQFANGKIASDLKDIKGDLKEPSTINFSSQFVDQRLGQTLSAEQMAQLLQNVEFDVKLDGDKLAVTPPFWRTDVEIAEDLVEEIGRLYGYEHLPVRLPVRDTQPARRDELLDLKSKIRVLLSKLGANEALTYSFVHGDLLEKMYQDKTKAYQLNNALSPDLQYYRLGLTPSLLERVYPNIRSDLVRCDDNEFALFEINKVHQKDLINNEGLPIEQELVGLTFAADDKTASRKYQGAPYYMAHKYLFALSESLGLAMPELVRMDSYQTAGSLPEWTKPFEPGRSAVILLEDEVTGIVGEYRAGVRRALKLPGFCAGFELDILAVQKHLSRMTYHPVPRFPRTQQDISFKVHSDVTYLSLLGTIWEVLLKIQEERGYRVEVGPKDIYQKTDKHITFRLWLHHPERTLRTEEVNKLLDEVAVHARDKLDAERI